MSNRLFDAVLFTIASLTVAFSGYPTLLSAEASKSPSEKALPANIEERISSLKITLLGLETKKMLLPNSKMLLKRTNSTQEQLAGYACLSYKKKILGHWRDQTPERHECQQSLGFLKKYIPESPILTCVNEGEDSDECYAKSMMQETLPWREATRRLDLRENTAAMQKEFWSQPNDPGYYTLKNSLSDLEAAYKEEPSEENRIALIQSVTKALLKACRAEAMIVYSDSETLGTTAESFVNGEDPELNEVNALIKRYKERVEQNNEPAPAPFAIKPRNTHSSSGRTSSGVGQMGRNSGGGTGLSPRRDPFTTDNRENDANKAAPAKPKEEEQDVVRVRILPNECFNVMEKLLNASPLSSLGICLKDGPFHPACKNAQTGRLGPIGSEF